MGLKKPARLWGSAGKKTQKTECCVFRDRAQSLRAALLGLKTNWGVGISGLFLGLGLTPSAALWYKELGAKQPFPAPKHQLWGSGGG